MPDRDVIHPNLAPRYKKTYKMICEGQSDYEFIAREAAAALRKDIQEYGNNPIRFLEFVADELNNLPAVGLFAKSIDWNDEYTKIEERAYQINADRQGMDIAMVIAKRAILMLQHYGQYSTYENLLTHYMSHIFEVNFVGRVPLPRYYMDASQDLVDTGISKVRFHVSQDIRSFVSTAAQTGNVAKLWRHKRQRAKYSTEEMMNIDISI